MSDRRVTKPSNSLGSFGAPRENGLDVGKEVSRGSVWLFCGFIVIGLLRQKRLASISPKGTLGQVAES
jgi:hypothetical protein